MSPSTVPTDQSSTGQDRASLCFTFQASGIRQAARLAAELGTMTSSAAHVHPSPPRTPGPRDWIVAVTTPPMPLTLEVLRPWEEEMLAVEHRWPGVHFLGWTTYSTPVASIGSTESQTGREGSRRQLSQRELVTASLLRCPPERGAIVHGRSAPR